MDTILLIENPENPTGGNGIKRSLLKDQAFRQTALRILAVLAASVIFMYGVYKRIEWGIEEPYWRFYFMAIVSGYISGVSLTEYLTGKLIAIQYHEITSFDTTVSAAIQKKLWKDIFWTIVITVLVFDACGLFTVWFYPWDSYTVFMPADIFSYITLLFSAMIVHLAWSMSPVHWKYKAIKKVRSLTISDEEIEEEEAKLKENKKDE